MTAQTFSIASQLDELLVDPTSAVASARSYIAESALTESHGGRVGLELEFHLVDLARPERRPDWDQIQALVAGLPPMPSNSSVTLEPGGQIELSTPPTADVVSSVAALAADRERLRTALARQGFGAAPLGSDPVRPARRINPDGRYVAMEQHFGALGCVESGRAMMTSTAALQVNLDAGPMEGWRDRLRLIGALGPVLIAASATSPWLGGRTSGWHSMRQGVWDGIDHSRSDPVDPDIAPTDSWATYALDAPVMLVRNGQHVTPITQRVPLRAWLRGEAPIGRRPTQADVDYHLTTLFPPVRPRGYVEIRCIDAMPDRWWPAMAALTTILFDDPIAAERAVTLVEPGGLAWAAAARDGPRDPTIRAAVMGCVAIAVDHCPAPLRPQLEAFAELLESGRTPSDVLRDRIESVGPLAVLEEEARA